MTSIFQNDPMILSTIATKLLDTIFLICDYTIIREQNNFENCLNEKENFSKSYQSINGRLDNSKMPIFFIEEADILYYCQEFLLSITNCSFDLLELIYTYPNLEKILMNGLILSDNSLLKEKFSIGLSDLLRAYSISEILIKPHQFFVPIFLNKILDIAFQYEERSKMFFSLLIATLDEISINNDVLSEKHLKNLPLQFNFQLDFYSLIKKLVLLIKDRKSSEESPEKDILLTCSLNLLKVLLNYVSENIEEISLNLVDELLFNCLFIVKNGSDSGDYNCKCKTFNSRMAAFNLLQALSLKKEKNLQKILDFFIPILRDSDWRTKSISDWNITPKGNEKSLTGYVGLNNLGCSKLHN